MSVSTPADRARAYRARRRVEADAGFMAELGELVRTIVREELRSVGRGSPADRDSSEPIDPVLLLPLLPYLAPATVDKSVTSVDKSVDKRPTTTSAAVGFVTDSASRSGGTRGGGARESRPRRSSRTDQGTTRAVPRGPDPRRGLSTVEVAREEAVEAAAIAASGRIAYRVRGRRRSPELWEGVGWRTVQSVPSGAVRVE